MDAQVLARWQFGITTVYHFFFVPVTIALSMLVAVLQTFWYKTGDEKYLRLTKFYGKLFLINFAMGVVTGIVQEFQFGMNWSEYSRFVGDIFGAPLALEALLAFFLESTFIGLWIFGWDKLPKGLHLATIYLAAIGTMISAVFILAANSWMQNPVGATYNAAAGRAELADFGAVLTNPVFLVTFPHQITASYMTAGGFIAGVAGWKLAMIAHDRRKAGVAAENVERDSAAYRFALKFGAWVMLIASLGVMFTGDIQGKIMTDVQPMKMAAAEALYETVPAGEGAPFSVLSVGSLDGKSAKGIIEVPGLLSFLATGDFKGEVKGINDLQKQYATGKLGDERLQQEYASALKASGLPTDFAPNIPVAYWTFRIMMGLGFAATAIGLWMLWAVRGGRTPKASALWLAAMAAVPLLPLFGNSFGWIFTEMGRQPWLVFGVMPTLSGVSPGVSAGAVLFSMIVYTLVYGALAVIEVGLIVKYIKMGLPEVTEPTVIKDEDAPLTFAY